MVMFLQFETNARGSIAALSMMSTRIALATTPYSHRSMLCATRSAGSVRGVNHARRRPGFHYQPFP